MFLDTYNDNVDPFVYYLLETIVDLGLCHTLVEMSLDRVWLSPKLYSQMPPESNKHNAIGHPQLNMTRLEKFHYNWGYYVSDKGHVRYRQNEIILDDIVRSNNGLKTLSLRLGGYNPSPFDLSSIQNHTSLVCLKLSGQR